MENGTVENTVLSRPLKCEFNVLSRPDGSAVLAQGETVYLAAVYGPVEVKIQRIQIEKASVEAVYKPKSGQSAVQDRIKECIIKSTCEAALVSSLHPRTAINIILQEIQDCGGSLACAVNAACLALISSGISMKFLVAAVSCMIDEDGHIILDPDRKQLQDSCGILTFVFESSSSSVVASHTEGLFNEEQYEEALIKCRITAVHIFKYYREVVKKYAPKL